MANAIALHEGVIRPGLVAELESFRAPGRRMSSYYLDLDPQHGGTPEAMRVEVKNSLAKHRERLNHLDLPHAQRLALRHDWELVQELALQIAGKRGMRSLACFVASEADFTRALPLPWPVRNRAFFEESFVLWPLRLILEQADRYAICLTDKEKARLFRFYLEQIEEVVDVFDQVPGRVRFPDVLRQLQYQHKHIEHFHHHFEKTAQAALRLFQCEPFEHLIVGGRWETLPQFESHLHRYLHDRVIARWENDVRTPISQIRERAQEEEQRYLQGQAQNVWKTIQDEHPSRGALGPEEVLAALWQRRAQTLLIEPGVVRGGFRCTACGRLHLGEGPCVECGGKMAAVPDILEEAVHEAVEQSARVLYWKDAALTAVGSVAVLKRF